MWHQRVARADAAGFPAAGALARVHAWNAAPSPKYWRDMSRSGWERIAKITLTLGTTSSMSFAVARNLGRSPYSGVASKPHGGAPALETAGNWRR